MFHSLYIPLPGNNHAKNFALNSCMICFSPVPLIFCAVQLELINNKQGYDGPSSNGVIGVFSLIERILKNQLLFCPLSISNQSD